MVSVMDFFINDSDPTEWYRKTDVINATGVNRESTSQALGTTKNVGPRTVWYC